MKLLPVIPRTESGYRIFDDGHLEQLRLLRTGFRVEIINDRLRQEVIEIVKTAAEDDICEATQRTQKHLEHLREEKGRAEEAIRIAIEILDNENRSDADEQEVLAVGLRQLQTLASQSISYAIGKGMDSSCRREIAMGEEYLG